MYAITYLIYNFYIEYMKVKGPAGFLKNIYF